jgi:single-strand DNA-binding protein
MNQVLLKGNVGNNIKVIEKENSPTLIMFSIATNESYKDKNEEFQTKTNWVNVKAFGITAESAKNLKSGDFIFLDGEIKTEKWTDKLTQKENYSQNVIMKEFTILKNKITPEKEFIHVAF